ncbi:MAG: thermonuclease family protein [Pseudomonadota bacterium]
MRRLVPLLCLLAAACAQPPPTGRALSGDTIFLAGRTLRLAGIVAPRRGQGCLDAEGRRYDCFEAARAALGRLTDFQDISCAPVGAPARGPRRVRCLMAGRDLALAQARAGWALPDPDAPKAVRAAAREARQARRGLWAGQFETPAEFRARWGEAGPREGSARPSGECAIKGNIAGRELIYHLPGGANYAQVVISPEKGERWFCSEAEAIAAGWRRARR